jgi:hypothetical protein
MMKEETGETCDIYGGEKSYVQSFGEETGRKDSNIVATKKYLNESQKK